MAEVKKVSVNTDEEALIKKRLLTQTTTARPGADPPVKKLTKKYVAYVNALAQDDGDGDGTEAERAREASDLLAASNAPFSFPGPEEQ